MDEFKVVVSTTDKMLSVTLMRDPDATRPMAKTKLNKHTSFFEIKIVNVLFTLLFY